MLGLSKMRLCVLFALISVVISRPQGPEEQPSQDTPEDMQMLDEEDMKQLLTDLFISSSRDARQLELDEDADDGEDGDAADVDDVTDDADNSLEYEAAVDSDSKVKASEEEVARFNNYIDAIYRRMNAALRAKMMDPMTLNLDDKQKKKPNKPRSLGKREADDEDEDEERFDEKEDTPEVLEEEVMEHRAGKAEKKKKKGAVARKNKKNKNKKGKKGGKKEEEDTRSEKAIKKAEREAAKKEKQALREKKREERKKTKDEAERSLSKREAEDEEDEDDYDAVLAEDELMDRAGKPKGKGRKGSSAAARKNKKNKKGKKEDKEDKATKKAEREAVKKEKQEKKLKKQELREKKRAEKKKEKAGAGRRQSRSGQKNKNKKRQSNNKNKKSRNTNNKNKKSKSTNNKNKKNNNKGRSGNARNNEKNEKMMGSLSGIATLRREGDVMVKDEENHKIITSEFNVGPLQLEVSKMYGKGQARTVKSAKAITEVMSGTMTLKVKPDGSAHVKKVVFKEPENVDVKGSLSDNKPRNLRYLKNSVNKMRPLAAIRVLKTARYVLKSPNSSAN